MPVSSPVARVGRSDQCLITSFQEGDRRPRLAGFDHRMAGAHHSGVAKAAFIDGWPVHSERPALLKQCRPTSASERAGRHSAVLTDTSMSASATSSLVGTNWQGVAHIGSPLTSSTENSVLRALNACHLRPRRVPCGETSRRAGCRKSARPVR
jgi:hypothetical protein